MSVCSKAASVLIVICTFQRPQGLTKALQSLSGLQFGPELPEVNIHVLVVDNDPNMCGFESVQQIEIPFPVSYVHEEKRGISNARNRGREFFLQERYDFLAFIDDDEECTPQWLHELLWVQIQADADVVTGPVLPRYEVGVPAWIQASDFFHFSRHDDLTEIDYARTGNVLIRRSVLQEISFDNRFGLSGGEDTLFFMLARRKGARFYWADKAIVKETIPTTRATARWLVRRSYRVGNALCRIDFLLNSKTLPVVLTRVGKAVVRISLGFANLLLIPFHGKAASVRAKMNAARGLGMLAGIVGRSYHEYR